MQVTPWGHPVCPADRSETDLYVPGLTPLSDERARELQEFTRTTLQDLQDGTARTATHPAFGAFAWRSLPEEDQELWWDDVKTFCEDTCAASDAAGVDQVMQAWFWAFLAWRTTVSSCEELGVDSLIREAAGDGPDLDVPEQAPADRSRPHRERGWWTVRAANESVEPSWREASSRTPSAASTLLDRLRTQPLEPGHFGFVQYPLQGGLKMTRIGGRELERWETWTSASYTVSRRSSGQRVYWQGDMKVTYAPDPAKRTVWVEGVRLVELFRDVRKVPHNSQASRRPKKRR